MSNARRGSSVISVDALITVAIGSFGGLSERFSCQSRQPQQRAGADGLMSSGGRKCPAGEIQVCERQQREHLGPVLGDAAIAVRRQRSLDRTDGLNKGEFLA